jgi:hypothetical protein
LKNPLDVSSIFYSVHWSPNSSAKHFTISNVFASNRIKNCRSAFNGSYSETSRKQYLTFVNVFSKDKEKHPESADYYVFYGYAPGYVTHETDKTCSTIEDRYNYADYKD